MSSFSKELGITEEGSINELDQTEPDIEEVSNPRKVTNISGRPIVDYDEALNAVLKMEGIQ